MEGYFMMLGAIPGFFLSSFFLMVLWGVTAPWLGIATVGYANAMLITFTLWLAVAPLAVVRKRCADRHKASAPAEPPASS